MIRGVFALLLTGAIIYVLSLVLLAGVISIKIHNERNIADVLAKQVDNP